jgi:hypothetical protein
MIEDGVSIPALDDSWWILWHVGGGIVLLPTFSNLKPVNFPESNFQSGFGFWNFQFTKNPSQLPKIRPIANLLSSKLQRWKFEIGKSKYLPIAQDSPNSPKNLLISHPVAKFQFLKSKNYPT